MIKVSLVIPVYNVENYIEQCLDSVLNQTLKEIEVICVDDGSTDRSLEILRAYEEKDKRVHVLTQENQYAGVARNHGMDYAQGKYIIFLDSDDFIEPEMIREMYEKAQQDKAQICVCNGRTFDDKTKEYGDVSHYLIKKQLPEKIPFSAEECTEYLFQFTTPAPWNKLYLREYLIENKLRFQEIKRTNDMYFTYMSFVYADRITVTDKRFINYRINVETSLQGSNQKGTYEFIDALLAIKKRLTKENLWKTYEKSFANRALSTCLFNIDKVSDKESFVALYNKLIDETFYKLALLAHVKRYYYNSTQYDRLAYMVRHSAEEAWEEKINEGNDNSEILDIEKWKRPQITESDNPIKVSVVIPIYNVEEYIEECVESVVLQTLSDIEILCINDGTKDNSIEKIQKYIDTDDRVRLINKENGGLSQTRNVGMEEAKGEYVLFLDSDDYLVERALEILYYEAKKQDLDQLYYSASMFYDDCNSVLRDNYYERKNDYYNAVSGQELFYNMVKNADFKPSACLVLNRRTFLLESQLKFKEGLIHEDNLFTVQAMYFSKKSAYINANLYMRRVRQNSIMTDGQNFRHAYFHYVIIKELKKFAIEQKIDKAGNFFKALMIQIERLQVAGGNYILNMNPKELNEEMNKFSEEDFFDFNVYIVSVGKQREKFKQTLERARGNGQAISVFRQRGKVLKDLVAQKNKEIKELKTQNKKLKKTELSKLKNQRIKENLKKIKRKIKGN